MEWSMVEKAKGAWRKNSKIEALTRESRDAESKAAKVYKNRFSR